jgi:hypothetical protein
MTDIIFKKPYPETEKPLKRNNYQNLVKFQQLLNYSAYHLIAIDYFCA